MNRIDHAPFILIKDPLAGGFTLNTGEVIKAKVMNLLSSGYVSLKIKGSLISVKSEIPLEVGEVLTLKVKGPLSDGSLGLQIISESIETTDSLKIRIQPLLQEIEGIISGGIRDGSKFDRLLSQLLKSLHEDLSLLPSEMRERIVGLLLKSLLMRGDTERLYLNHISGSLSSVENLNERTLKILLENTGVLLEVRLKKVVEGDNTDEVVQVLKKDLKANLLKLTEEGRADKAFATIIKVIETFQVLSKVTDSFYTFLPPIWGEMRNGNIMLRKREDKRGDKTYACRIYLELERYGRLSVMVILHDKDFFISFVLEDPRFRKLLEDSKELLQGSFAEKGMNLKAINLILSDTESPWPYGAEGIDFRV